MSLARSSVAVGLAAAASRTLGFTRDVLIAGLLGAGPVADAFLIAYRLPNLLRAALAEGGLNAGFVPPYLQRRATRGPADAGRFANEAVSGLALVLLGLVALVEAGAGGLVLLLATGAADAPGTLDLAALYARLLAPALAGTGLAALVAARLNAERRFVAAALAPVAASATVVVTLAALSARGSLPPEDAAAWLSAAIAFAGLLHLALVAAAARRLDPPLAWLRPRPSQEMGRLLGLGAAGLVASGASHLILLAGMQVASSTPSAVSWLYYAERVFHLPVGLVGAAMGLVLLSEMAGRHAAGDRDGFARTQRRALEAAFLLGLPAACALALLARPIAAVLFQRGAFTAADAQGTAAILAGLAVGVPFAVAAKVLAQSLVARGDILAALWTAAAAVAVTLLAAALLGAMLGPAGIGLGISIGFVAQAAALARRARRAGGEVVGRSAAGRVGRMAAASLVMAAGLTAAEAWLDAALGPSRPTHLEALWLLARCAGGFALYALAALALGAVTQGDLAALRRA